MLISFLCPLDSDMLLISAPPPTSHSLLWVLVPEAKWLANLVHLYFHFRYFLSTHYVQWNSAGCWGPEVTLTPSSRHTRGTQPPKQVVNAPKMSVAGLGAPGWLPCLREGLWLKAESLTPSGGVAAPKSWTGGREEGRRASCLGAEAGAS